MSSVSPRASNRAKPKRPGRPRDLDAQPKIVKAALELMAEQGVRDLRMDDVAQRAGVGKATIYRRYRSKEELVAFAVRHLVSEIAVPDSGSTAEDVRILMRNAVRVYENPKQAGVMPGLVEAMRRNERLARAVREGFLAKRRALLKTVLERGVARGDLRTDIDYELALDVFGGPLFYRLLITGGPIDDELADGVTELVLRGFAPAEPTARGVR
jgi:AcrR family transcriptional regulator